MPEIDPTKPHSGRDAKPFAWAGIALTIPRGWETAQLGQGYALLEYQFRPVLELKTATIRGRFSFQHHLKQLTRSGQKRSFPQLKLTSRPPEWPEFPATAEVQSFTWQGAHIGGQGLLVYCRHCHRATLIQFFKHGDRGRDAIPRVLASFKDHDTPPGPTFAVYDIQATLPARFTLARFQFDAGRFELVFSHSRETVSLWRWSPADVILERCGKKLARVVLDNGLLPPAVFDEGGQPRDRGLEWQWQPKDYRSRLRHIFGKRTQRPGHALRIWHRPDSNRIFAVRAEGIETFNVFDRICTSYGNF